MLIPPLQGVHMAVDENCALPQNDAELFQIRHSSHLIFLGNRSYSDLAR